MGGEREIRGIRGRGDLIIIKQRLTSPVVFALSVSLGAHREESEEERELFNTAVSSGIMLK